MKKALFILLFFLPCLGFAQKKSIDGFMDIPFGSDSATVKSIIAAKGGVKDNTSYKDHLVFTGLSLSNRKVLILSVKFVDNKAYEAIFGFNEFAESDALNYYDIFSKDIAAVYGKGDMSNNFGNSSNSLRIKRLKSGNVFCKTLWQSKNKNTILLQFAPIDQSIYIELTYQSDDLWDLNASKRRSDL